ncbi:MAG TPA: response regulator [Vicinamibacterales bacterium]|nr:response regulator [Vicinamibacterales bacterium]
MTVVTPRVLVVSESRITRRVVEMTFADQSVELATAVTGPAGIEAWDAAPAAVVLADVTMAPLDGLAIARHVQATAGTRSTAVLLMAGHSDVIDQTAAAEADVRGVIRKPLDSMQLIEAVREVLRAARPPRPAAVPAVVPPAEREAGVRAEVELEPTGHEPEAVAPAEALPTVLGDADIERVAARVAAIWSGDARHEARVEALVAARAEDVAAASAAAAAERLVREMAPALVQQVARLVVVDVSERLVREEITRMRAQRPAH